jgi:hypothetical protein
MTKSERERETESLTRRQARHSTNMLEEHDLCKAAHQCSKSRQSARRGFERGPVSDKRTSCTPSPARRTARWPLAVLRLCAYLQHICDSYRAQLMPCTCKQSKVMIKHAHAAQIADTALLPGTSSGKLCTSARSRPQRCRPSSLGRVSRGIGPQAWQLPPSSQAAWARTMRFRPLLCGRPCVSGTCALALMLHAAGQRVHLLLSKHETPGCMLPEAIRLQMHL